MSGVLQRLKDAFNSEKRDETTNRERWDSRISFILAASGSAIGLGNLWRFPMLAFKYGGGAFFVPYWLALFLIGIPILTLELSLGQVIQSGDIACFGGMNKRLRGIGLGSVFGGFMVVCYYNVIISWALIYFVNCFRDPLPWAPNESASGQEFFAPGHEFLYGHVLNLSADPNEPPSMMSAYQFAGLVVTWFCIIFVLWKGVSRTSKVVFVTMILPLVTIVILIIRGATLEGSLNGVKEYIGIWDMSVLQTGSVWVDATGQIFFSIGITFGIMTAYSSYNSRHQDAVQDSIIIALMNCGVSFFAGFAVFSVMGYISLKSGIPIRGEDGLNVGGPGLVFLTYPVGLSTLPAAGFFCAIFYLTLFFLGIDSAFSLVEAVLTAVRDSSSYTQANRHMLTLVVSGVAFLIGCLYTTNIGLYLLDAIDAYINTILMLFIGLMECFAASWVYESDEQIRKVGALAVYTLGISWLGGAAVGSLIALSDGYAGVITGATLGCAIMLFGSIIAFFLCRTNVGAMETARILYFYPIETLRRDLNEVLSRVNPKGKKKWPIPFVWSVLMKFFITPALIILLMVSIEGYIATPYGLYPKKYQAAGIFLALVGITMVIVPMWKYKWLEGWMPSKESGHYLSGDNEAVGIQTGDFELDEIKTDETRPTKRLEDDEVVYECDQAEGGAGADGEGVEESI